jgi:hypothetical protein
MDDDALFRWIHVSDLHFGQGGPGEAPERKLLLEALLADIETNGGPADALLVTGDVAFRGARADYAEARTWLLAAGGAVGVGPERTFLVPGNHDVDRKVDVQYLVALGIERLRDGTASLDAALADPQMRSLLASRQESVLDFAAGFAPWAGRAALPAPDERLHWEHTIAARGGLLVRFAGLNTALLAKGEDERKLALGVTQIEARLPPPARGELIIVLSHHPFHDAWLKDASNVNRWVRQRAHVHLSGHVHEADSEETKAGHGSAFVRVVAGAAQATGGSAGEHGYTWGEVRRSAGGKLVLRIHPRRWSARQHKFVLDADCVPDGQKYAEHALPVELPPPSTIVGSGGRFDDNDDPPRSPPVVNDGAIEFAALDPTDLEQVCVVAQSLDNQWVPRSMLSRMLARGRGLPEVREAREHAVRAEYIRALINTEQVVVNRAYLYNNPVVFRDFTTRGPEREAFRSLLAGGVIVPYLFKEGTPVDEPKYTTNVVGFPAWKELCGEVRSRCVRLSWDDKMNDREIAAKLAGRFHEFSLTASSRDEVAYAQQLGIPDAHVAGFKEQLHAMARMCVNLGSDKKVTRDQLYRAFVTIAETNTDEGRYDANKPFAGPLKQLIDLSYNVNLPDALGRYALTPFDSLPRTTLQDWRPSQMRAPFGRRQWQALLERTDFELLPTGLYLDTFARLDLQDVLTVRQTEEWRLYMNSVRALLGAPTTFSHDGAGAAQVYRRFTDLVQVMTRLTADRSKKEPWTPVIELAIDMAGAVVTIQWKKGGATYAVHGAPSWVYGAGQAPVMVTLNIRDAAPRSDQSDLATNVSFWPGRLGSPAAQFEELCAHLAGLSWMKEERPANDTDQQATLNQPESE